MPSHDIVGFKSVETPTASGVHVDRHASVAEGSAEAFQCSHAHSGMRRDPPVRRERVCCSAEVVASGPEIMVAVLCQICMGPAAAGYIKFA